MKIPYTATMVKQAESAKKRVKDNELTVPFSYYGDIINKAIKTFIRGKNEAEIAILHMDKKSSNLLYFIIQKRDAFEKNQVIENEKQDYYFALNNLISTRKFSKIGNFEMNRLVNNIINNAEYLIENQEQSVVAVDENAVAYFIFS